MSLINFTVECDLLAAETDSSDSGIDVDLVALTGSVVFTPVLDEYAVLAPDFDVRPTAFRFLPVVGWMDDGRLKAKLAGSLGVRLVANDPLLGLPYLVYRVDFRLSSTSGQRIPITSGYFAAPATEGIVYLPKVLKPTLALAIAAEPDPPEPIDFLIFTDDGDSTWSVTTVGDWCATVDGFTDNGDSTFSAELDGPPDCGAFAIYGVTLTDNNDSTFDLV